MDDKKEVILNSNIITLTKSDYSFLYFKKKRDSGITDELIENGWFFRTDGIRLHAVYVGKDIKDISGKLLNMDKIKKVIPSKSIVYRGSGHASGEKSLCFLYVDMNRIIDPHTCYDFKLFTEAQKEMKNVFISDGGIIVFSGDKRFSVLMPMENKNNC